MEALTRIGFGLFGLAVLIGIAWTFSNNKKAVDWKLVGTGVALQIAFAAFVLMTTWGGAIFEGMGKVFVTLIGFTTEGSKMILGGFADQDKYGFVFIFHALPTVIFFASFMAVLYHLGVMQWIVRQMARVMVRLMGTSGSESLSACANVFVGQTEAPLLIKPFLKTMTMSELHAIMVGGFATIAGGVFALYVGLGVNAGHLMVASVMAVPAGLICTKMLWPETEHSATMGSVGKVETEIYGNVVEAAAAGAGDGLKLALNVAAMLIAFLGLVEVLNGALHLFSADWSVQGGLGIVFWPVAAVMGVPSQDIGALSQLLGTKLALTELVAYKDLGPMIKNGTIAPRTAMIASFALCGFANIGSVAIQVGGLGALAPERRSDLAKLGLRAMFGGAIATCMTACVAGVLAEVAQ